MISLGEPLLQKLTKAFINDDALILKAICEFEAASECRAANAKEEKTAEQQTADEHKSFVDSIVIIFQCCWKKRARSLQPVVRGQQCELSLTQSGRKKTSLQLSRKLS